MFIYMLINWLLYLMIFLIVLKFVKKNILKKIFIILLVICALINVRYIYNNNGSLENYKGTYIGDNSSVSNIIELLGINKTSISLQTAEIPYVLTINLSNDQIIADLYLVLEEDAAIMFNLITNADTIVFSYNSKDYIFQFEHLNMIFDNNLRDISINDIRKRYTTLSNEYLYVGNIDGYDLYDESSVCESNEQLLKEENSVKYYLTCTDINELYFYKDEKKVSFTSMLDEISIDSLLQTNLNIYTK
ncbi:MAG: DUF4825 domain-containing protein [Bacilli bacterium]|nr:DUF4825 domain-containing protein [Bacilli bacterium]